MSSFNFNGDFKRKPEQVRYVYAIVGSLVKLVITLSLQSLGGALNPRSRNTLISNAKQERERRDLIRRQNEVHIRRSVAHFKSVN